MTSARTRDRLIARLREQGIANPQVLERIRSVPRHLFVDEALASRAYEDTALPIGHGQTISQPYVVAWGADPRSGMQLKPLVIAYEKEGLSGVRFVYTAMGVMLMGPDEFKEANFPPGHKPE